MNQFKHIHTRAHTDLMRIGPQRWAVACSSVRRYQMMTSNIAEYVNSCLKHARQMPITVLIEFIIDMFQRWFHDRYEEVVKVTTPLNPWVASKCKRVAIEFCVDYYKTTILVEGYSGSIRPVGYPSEWDIPLHVKQIVVLPPPWKGQAGNPRRRRIPSTSERS
ncbi:PREDICTED: uncharacterized protein LOC108663021 [Theobroma cacao]|uniref:Uncharacterized protein LOC108663021 n=1 Tax=Theobroma cacao TaxID=3641 RepID=A0AB32WQQ1_THECC|nr:PREDICTED: uncharacterized protein LOC108663021 [Theobroma cacao]